jgi:hypothetical protein
MLSIKKNIAGTYFWKLYRKGKALFFFVFLFFFLNVFVNIFLRLEATPFFVWDMYSTKAPLQSEYAIYEVWYNGKVLNIPHSWEEPRKMLLFDPLAYYVSVQIDKAGKDPFREYLEDYWGLRHPQFKSMLPRLYNNPEQFKAFPEWYKRYLSQQFDEKVNNITIIRKNVCFTEDAGINALSSDTIMVLR